MRASLSLLFVIAAAEQAAGQCTEQLIEVISPGRGFGHAVDVEGDLMAVGMVDPDVHALGQLFVFTRTGPHAPWNWGVNLNSFVDPRMGQSVAVSDGRVAVGSPGADGGRGEVYVVEFGGPAGVTAGPVASPTPAPDGAEFGHAVALDGDRLVVGEPGAFLESGRVHIFARQPDGTWQLETTFGPVGLDPGDRLGESVAVSGDFVAAGVPGLDGSFSNTGGVHFLEWFAGSGWFVVSTIVGLGQDDLRFGEAVALDGIHAVVGSPHFDAPATDAGKLDFFVHNGTSFEHVLSVPGVAANGHLGWSVDLQGDIALAGIPDDDTLGPAAGRVGLYRQQGGTWIDTGLHWQATDTAARHRFGFDVAVDGGSVAVGSQLRGRPGGEGTIHTYELAGFGLCVDIASSLPGTGGVAPVLSGTGATSVGGPVTLSLSQGAPSTLGLIFAGLGAGDAPFLGGVLVPSPDVSVPIATDGTGAFTLVTRLPAGLPAGMSLWVQAWLADAAGPQGASASNTRVLVAP